MNLKRIVRLDTVLATLLLIVGVAILLLSFNDPLNIKITNNGNLTPITRLDELNSNTGNNIVTEFNLKKNLLSANHFDLKTDDCLLELRVNSQKINLAESIKNFENNGYCDYNTAVTINLSKYLTRDTNKIEIISNNNSGNGGVIWKTSYYNSGILLGVVLIALACLYFYFQIVVALNIDIINSCFALVILLLGIGVKAKLLAYQSGDYGSFLTHWYDHIKNNGYWAAHGTRFSDYTPPYLYLMTISALLPIKKIVAIKAISLIFEVLLAVAVFLVVKQKNQSSSKLQNNSSARNLAIVAAITSYFLPTVILNGSMWGQCDVIYTSFTVLTLYALIKDKGWLIFLMFGLAFAFKFQTMFLAPLLLIWLIFNPNKFYYAFIVPLVYVVACIPAAIAGRPWSDLLRIYLDQSSSYPALNSGLINFWKFIPEVHSQIFSTPGILLGAVAGLAIPVLIYNLKPKFTSALWVRLALVCTLLLPFVLPKMHERYYFSAEIFALIYAFYFPKQFWVAIAVSIFGVFSYLPFLLGRNIDEYSFFLAMAMLGVIAYLIYDLINTLLNLKQLNRFENAKAVARLPGN